MKGTFIVIVGPSASGKTELVNALIKKVPNSARLITMTTRPKRLNEEHEKDYFFVSRGEFEKKIKEEKLMSFGKENYLLFELSYLNRPDSMSRVIFDLNNMTVREVRNHQGGPRAVHRDTRGLMKGSTRIGGIGRHGVIIILIQHKDLTGG